MIRSRGSSGFPFYPTMETGDQTNQQVADDNTPPKGAINNHGKTLDRYNQTGGQQSHHTPFNLKLNHYKQPQLAQPKHHDLFYTIPPYNQHTNPLFAPIPNGCYEEPDVIQQHQQVQPVDQNARTIADFTKPVVQPYLRQPGIPRINTHTFKLKPALITMVQNNQFGGEPTDDPHAHLRTFLDYSGTCKLNGIPEDT